MNFSRINALLNWSVRVGKLFGVPINLHISLVFFLWPVLAVGRLGFWYEVEYAVGVVFCILLHELGHALTAKRYGLSGLSIMLHGFGGFAVSSGYRTPKQALVITLAGPAVTFALGILGLAIGTAGLNANTLGTGAYLQFHIVHSLGVLNILLGFLNLIPSLPFDGGHALVAILSQNRPELKANRAVAHLGLVLDSALTLYGFITDHQLVAMFGLIGLLNSGMYLMQSGGVRFGEVARDRRARKDDEAFKKRQHNKNQAYVAEVAEREREREEKERLRKLFE